MKRDYWDKLKRQQRAQKEDYRVALVPVKKVPKAKVRIFKWGVHRAEWRKFKGVWGCWKADPGLRWMIGITAEQAAMEIKNRGMRPVWV